MDQQLTDRHRRQSRIGGRADARKGAAERLRKRRVEGQPAAIDQMGDAHAGDRFGKAGERNRRAHHRTAHGHFADRLAGMNDDHAARPLPLLDHPGPPGLLDALDRLGAGRSRLAGQQAGNQEKKANATQTDHASPL